MELNCKVLKVLYQNIESGTMVFVAALRDGTTLRVKGMFHDIQPGNALILTGSIVESRRYGRQFEASEWRRELPVTKEGIIKYLSSGAVRGIGAKTARLIVEHFGEETYEVIENAPERLMEVPGIGQKKVETLVYTICEDKVVRDIMTFFRSYGVGEVLAGKVFAKYGRRSVETVRENPYRLIDDFDGVGFIVADGIARSMGIRKDDPNRLRHGILYVMDQVVTKGDAYAEREAFLKECGQLLDVDAELLGYAFTALVREVRLVDDQGRVYLRSLYDSECIVAARIAEIAATKPMKFIPSSLTDTFLSTYGGLDQWQSAAVRQFSCSKVMVLTGGPGTGKTYTLKAMLRLAGLAGLSVSLAAPTGRAAKRMTESVAGCLREGDSSPVAVTVHRLLDYGPDRETSIMEFRLERLSCDLLIVDESSMVDVRMMDAIVSRLPSASRLLLVGDVCQLPSVGPGNVLRDLIDSRTVGVARLEKIHRQGDDSLIARNASIINSGSAALLRGSDKADFFRFSPREGATAWSDEQDARLEVLLRKEMLRLEKDAEAAAATDEEILFEMPKSDAISGFHCHVLKHILTLCGGRLAARGFQFRDIQVLVPRKKGNVGVFQLNRLIQAWMNPSGEHLTVGSTTFRVGDRVLQLKNNYTADVFNGDVGFVESVSEEYRSVAVRFPDTGRLVGYGRSSLDELMLAYAMTVHKSQGSEFPVVIVPVLRTFAYQLQRNLVYTAVTRARDLCILITEGGALEMAVKRNDARRRNTHLMERLREEQDYQAQVSHSSLF